MFMELNIGKQEKEQNVIYKYFTNTATICVGSDNNTMNIMFMHIDIRV